ncbi:MAG: DUF4234 domain-containing protein [Pseudomonadales bacterium]|nr:DUF4234 domain-containing protein [Pseudomonadales bacterium]
METESGNIYEAPESQVLNENDANGINNFDRFTAWGVFGLTIITFGLYPLYWLYSRANTINTFHSTKISSTTINAFLVLIALSTGASIAVEFYPDNEILGLFNLSFSLTYFVSYIVMLFTFKNRLSEIAGKSINPALTFFGTAIYLQYKINQTIDEKSSSIN